jgi:hypothetical protein
MGGRDDNGGDWSPEGGSADDLPDFPEEWGVIVIPDDLSELSEEVEAIRAELRLEGRRTRWQRFVARPAMRRLRRAAALAVKAPILIISMAVLVTVASLFASAWPGPPRTPATQRPSGATEDHADTLPALELQGTDGRTVALRAHLPAVVLVTDGCDCAQLIIDTAFAVRQDVAVVTVTTTFASFAAPSSRAASTPGSPSGAATAPAGATPQVPGAMVRELRDPTGELRKNLGLGVPDGTATALLVNRTGEIVRAVFRARSVEEFRADLARI